MVYVFIEIMHYETGVADANCKNYPLVWPMYFHLVFIIVQTFFIFKGVSVATNYSYILPQSLTDYCKGDYNSQVYSNKRKIMVSTGLMHVLATNLCVWFRFLVKEVEEGIYTISYATAYTNTYYLDDEFVNSTGIGSFESTTISGTSLRYIRCSSS